MDFDALRLAFLTWDRPDMPWDSARLNVAAIGPDGSLGAPKTIAGGDGAAAFQPTWSARTGWLYLVLDKGGWIPHSTTEILANRYGDCKDYSTIIYALLKAKDIESYPVLIRAEMGDWFPEVATPDYFNHAIL